MNESTLNSKSKKISNKDNQNREVSHLIDGENKQFLFKIKPLLGLIYPPLLAFACLFLLWEVAVKFMNINAVILPSPSSIFFELATSLSFYIPHMWVTFYEAIMGFFLGTIFALIGGIMMSHSQFIERTLLPIAILANVTPVVVLAPLFMIWFGYGPFPKILVAAIITFFPMLINSITGFRAVDSNNYEYLQSLHANKLEIFIKLRLPSSLPYLFSAAKTCISLSVIGAVVGEMSGASKGLGNIVMQSASYMQIERMFAAIMILAAMGICLTSAVKLLERCLLSWKYPRN